MLKTIISNLKFKVRSGRIRKALDRDSYFVHIDSPSGEVTDPYEILVGVLFLPVGSKVKTLEIQNGNKAVTKVLMHERHDLNGRYGHAEIHGFTAVLANNKGENSQSFNLLIELDSGMIQHSLDLVFTGSKYAEFEKRKKDKRDRMEGLFQCPSCLVDLKSSVKCPDCNSDFAANDKLDFRENDLRKDIDMSSNGNISAHSYDEKAMELIEKHKNGLILDNGSGLRKTYYSNVVNFEIEDYLSTDVLGVGEHLPFKDATFDAVFSLSVLEHVRDPFACVAEIMRVLKPGGDLYVAVPFLQPFHGYPNHYYNMTSSGLKNLFEGRADIEKVGVSRAGHPFHTLRWILSSYSNGLSAVKSDRFENLKVKDLIDPSIELQQQLESQLSEVKRDELASFNYLLGKKPD